MSYTYAYTNIVTSLDETGVITQISFDATASDDLGNTATKSDTSKGTFSPPADTTVGYTDTELQNICAGVAQNDGVIADLDFQVTIKRTPIYVAPPPPAPPTDDEIKSLWMTQIDGNVASVYSQFTRFQMEYEQREKAAQTYKDAGYTGDPTVWLTAFADSNNMTYQDCADLVLSQASNLRNAVQTLGQYRMDKYKVKNAATMADAETEFNTIIDNIATLARSL